MGACRFTLSDTNPNAGIGGSGCLCSELANYDQAGPFAVFYGNQMENPLSPHVVLCVGCARAFCGQVEDGAELARLGTAVDATCEELPAVDARPEQPESPEMTSEELAESISAPKRRRAAVDDEELTL